MFFKNTFIKNIIKTLFKKIKLQMFPIATFYFGHFFILCNPDYGTYSMN